MFARRFVFLNPIVQSPKKNPNKTKKQQQEQQTKFHFYNVLDCFGIPSCSQEDLLFLKPIVQPQKKQPNQTKQRNNNKNSKQSFFYNNASNKGWGERRGGWGGGGGSTHRPKRISFVLSRAVLEQTFHMGERRGVEVRRKGVVGGIYSPTQTDLVCPVASGFGTDIFENVSNHLEISPFLRGSF